MVVRAWTAKWIHAVSVGPFGRISILSFGNDEGVDVREKNLQLEAKATTYIGSSKVSMTVFATDIMTQKQVVYFLGQVADS